jgi:hypothetical protein
MKTEEAAVVSVRDITDEGKARINLRWEGKHQIADFDLAKLGKVIDSEDETEQSGWVFVKLPVDISVGKTIPLIKEAG